MYNESRLEADPRSSMNELSGVGTRVPRGILKNNGRNSGGDYGGPGEGVSPVPMGHNYMNMNQPHLVPHPSAYAHHPGPVNPPMNIHPSHSHVYPPDYGSHPMFNMQPGISQAYQHQVNPHATQWGLNYENRAPRSPTPPPSPESLCRQKLDTFVSSKRKSLFRQLAQEEKPLLESRLEERKSEGNYGVAPPIDYFLPLDASERIKEFMKSVQIGDIVIGEVDSSSPAGLVLILLCCDGGKRAYLEDLEIQGTCSPNQIVPPSDTADPNKSYEEEDYVRCEVLEISYESRKVGLGMKGTNLSQEIRHAFPLGLISHEDLPVQYLLTRSEVKSRRRRSYEQILDDSAGFHNPNSIVCLGTSLGVFSFNHSLMAGLRGTFLKKDMANELRNAQNAKWAQYNVTLGIRHFKQGNQIEAFQCLNKAIIIDSQNVEGLVARGALYANNGSFDKAMEDFEAALKSNPDHFNGRKYMAETLVVVGKGQQDSGKGEEAINSYSKCLEMLPEHKESILSLMTLHAQIENLTITQLPSTALSKLLQVKDKLRSMIAAEIAKKKLRYYEKMDKNNGKDGSSSKKESTESSSSSGSSSDSDSSSSSNDDDSFRKGKKKKNKKRSKRKKRSKKNTKYSKDPSLSPFSRKLHANESTGSGLAGFSGTSYAEWGQQLGLVNKYPGHSDDDSQRSSRKSKDKKKSKKSKERRKKKKRSTSSSDSETPPQSKAAKKRDKGKVITDFGEIEEQLTAYFSKCEQGKPEARIPPQAVKITVEQTVDNNYNRFYDNSTRRIEVVPEPQKDLQSSQADNSDYEFYRRGSVPSAATGEAVPGITSGKIQLTDEFGNFQAQKIIRTVQNNQPEQAGRKFEMRFNVKPTTTSLVPTSVLDAAKNDLSHEKTNTGLPSSKWRTIGAAVEEPAYPPNSSTSLELSQEELRDKITQESYSSSTVPVSSREPSFVPLEDKVKSVSNDEHGDRSRSYSSRKRSKSTSPSRSRSRSRSMSPRWRRGRHESKGRRRSRSRSHSIVRRSRSRSESRGRYRSRSRSRSFSPGRRNFRLGQDYVGSQYQGRQPVRFFRGLHPAARRGSSRFHPQPSGGRDSAPSKFRNRFNRSRSRSPSYGRRSISLSPTRIRRSRSPNYAAKLHGPVPPRSRTSTSARTPHRQTDANTGPLEKSRIETSKHGGVEGEKSGSRNQKMLNKGSEHENTEMNVCGLKTKKIADVEELLDKHKAHKKEEMRENNPEFFRHP